MWSLLCMLVGGVLTTQMNDGLKLCGPDGCGAKLTPYAKAGWASAVPWFSDVSNLITLAIFLLACYVAWGLKGVALDIQTEHPNAYGYAAVTIILGPVYAVGSSWEAHRVLADTAVLVALVSTLVLGVLVFFAVEFGYFIDDQAEAQRDEDRQA
jgi:hypothetical protein